MLAVKSGPFKGRVWSFYIFALAERPFRAAGLR